MINIFSFFGINRLIRGWLIIISIFYLLSFVTSQTVPVFYKIGSIFFSLCLLASGKFKFKFKINWKNSSYILILILCLFKAYWILTTDSQQISDFGVYFRCGANSKVLLPDWVASCQSYFLHATTLFWKRSFFYTSGINFLFQLTYFKLKIFNLACHLVTIFATYHYTKKYFSNAITFFAVAFVALYPEWWFTATLSTTDNLALPLLYLFFILINKYSDKSVSLIWTPIIGLIIFILAYLRTLELFLFLAMVLWIIDSPSKEKLKLLIVTFFIFFLFIKFFNAFWGLNRIPDYSILKSISSIDLQSTQGSLESYAWTQYFWDELPGTLRTEFSLVKIFREFSFNFMQFPSYLYSKVALFFKGNGYYSFAVAPPFLGGNPDSFEFFSNSLLASSDNLVNFFSSGIFIIILLSLKNLIFFPFNEKNKMMIFWYFSLSFILLTISEVQARYSLLIVPTLIIISIEHFSTELNQKQIKSGYRESVYSVMSCICIFTILLAISVAAKSHLKPIDRLLVRTTTNACPGPFFSTEIKAPDILEFDLNPSSSCISFEYTDVKSDVNFILSTTPTPPLWKKRLFPIKKIRILVHNANKIIQSEEINLGVSKWINLKFVKNEKVYITLLLNTEKNERLSISHLNYIQ